MRNKKEIKIITENWGEVDPWKIESYGEAGGYYALKKALLEMDQSELAEEIARSGLVGRGGAGYPMAEKIRSVRMEKSRRKYLICNLDESEPGTYKDRLIIDNNPHLVIEGMIILATIIGARKAFIYINGHYQKQADIISNALKQAEEKGYIGKNILNSGTDLEIEIVNGAGAYICGEETALLNSLEGKRPEPRIRPPYPTQKGFEGVPTLINNAETIANVPWIIGHGGGKYSEIGSEKSPGTKLVLVSGAVRKEGLYEIPLGSTLREVIFDWAGGIKKGKELWLVQMGGASGRIIESSGLDASIDYDPAASFPVGSGSILVFDTSVKLSEMMISWTDFFRRESCGKCMPCREGTFRLWEIAKRLQDGEISERDQQAIDDIIWTLKNTTFCPLGKFSATAFSDIWEMFKRNK
jgi:NADH-quinone oxidoreductase subunit F